MLVGKEYAPLTQPENMEDGPRITAAQREDVRCCRDDEARCSPAPGVGFLGENQLLPCAGKDDPHPH